MEQFGIIFGNIGFMGVPLIRGVPGNESVFYITVFIAVQTVFVWTYKVNAIYVVSFWNYVYNDSSGTICNEPIGLVTKTINDRRWRVFLYLDFFKTKKIQTVKTSRIFRGVWIIKKELFIVL